ncbi:hypothetical protein ACOSQ3_019323 [Xanthoceras sorbifolium]
MGDVWLLFRRIWYCSQVLFTSFSCVGPARRYCHHYSQAVPTRRPPPFTVQGGTHSLYCLLCTIHVYGIIHHVLFTCIVLFTWAKSWAYFYASHKPLLGLLSGPLLGLLLVLPSWACYLDLSWVYSGFKLRKPNNKHISFPEAHCLAAILGVQVVGCHERYLEMPSFDRRIK